MTDAIFCLLFNVGVGIAIAFGVGLISRLLGIGGGIIMSPR